MISDSRLVLRGWGLLLALGAGMASASEPASQDVAVPASVGSTLVLEWTGSALPGGSGAGSAGSLGTIAGAPDASVGCPPTGPDDAHTLNFTVPAGLYDTADVSADFHIEWEPGPEIPGGLATDPDLKLSVYRGNTELGSSDGGDPSETVRIGNPESGAIKAIVCPFSSSQPTPYTATLTVTVNAKAACLAAAPSKAYAHSIVQSGSLGGGQKDSERSGLLNFDLFRHETALRASPVPNGFQGRLQSVQFDRTLGKPTFLWARTDARPAAVGALASERDMRVARARAQLRAEFKPLQLTAAMIDDAEAYDAQAQRLGPSVVRFRQRVNGLEVFHRSLNVLIAADHRPVAVSGYFATDYDPARLPAPVFVHSGAEAVAAAWGNLGGVLNPASLAVTETRGDYQLFSTPLLQGNYVFERAPRAKKVYYPRAGRLEPAYYVEIFAKTKARGQLIGYAFVVSSDSRQLLYRGNLFASAAYSYRVFADDKDIFQIDDSPLGNGYTPFPGPNVSSKPVRTSSTAKLVTLEHGPISTGDPWLPEGATETRGNHVDACLDHVDNPANNVLSTPTNTCDPQLGDARGQTNGPNRFDYPIVADTDPGTDDAAQAAVVNLFYVNNWLHDWWYDHGFNEEAGNAQTDNFDRGGEDGDPIKAQAQDASGRNNANMGTPSDGSSPTMQQYLFDGPPIGEVRVTAPTDSGPLTWTAFNDIGPTSYTITSQMVALANDGVGASPSDGCGPTAPDPGLPVPPPAPASPPQPSLAGKIALIDRGNCNFTTKEQFAQASGAIAMVVVNNADGDPPSSVGNVDVPVSPVQPTAPAYTIPAVFIRKDDGQRIKDALAAGAVTMTLLRTPSVDSDGTLDNQIIAHEYFHYVHHRLTNSNNNQSGSMSEGWGDIDAFMVSARPEDTGIPGNEKWGGAYGLAGYVANNFFSGIRRAPYSTNFKLNGFTLKHIADGEPTPDGAAGATNSEVHAAGEIWANQMWNCYAGLLNDPRHSFLEARSRMKDYIIGGLKMTPADATFTEARDAVLAVALANDFTDYGTCSHGFAVRGSGLKAVSPARSSTDHVGVVEDYTEFVCKVDVPGGGGSSGGVVASGTGGRFGGGLGLWLLLPMLGFAGLRRRPC